MYEDWTRRNSGYDWSEGMSNRAVQAYEDGAKPKSKWTKTAIVCAVLENLDPISVEDCAKLRAGIDGHTVAWLRDNMLSYDSWHHTSSAYNRTDFWTVKDCDLEEYMEILARPEIKQEKRVSAFRMVRATFDVSVKVRRGWAYEEVSRFGVSDGKWFFPLDGYAYHNGKKSVGGNHYDEGVTNRSVIVQEWKRLHGGSIKGLKAYLGKYGL